jgi:hypothetical protein
MCRKLWSSCEGEDEVGKILRAGGASIHFFSFTVCAVDIHVQRGIDDQARQIARGKRTGASATKKKE